VSIRADSWAVLYLKIAQKEVGNRAASELGPSIEGQRQKGVANSDPFL